jgi:hypothetical protein
MLIGRGTQISAGGQEYILSSDTDNVNIFNLFGNPVDSDDFILIVDTGVTIGSTTSTNPSMDTGALPAGSTLTIINNGNIYGAGGASTADGGDSINFQMDTIVDNTNGYIFGGGGGGGLSGENGQSPYLGAWGAESYSYLNTMFGYESGNADIYWGGYINTYSYARPAQNGYAICTDSISAYQEGTFVSESHHYWIYKIKKATILYSARLARKSGGNGIGSNQAQSNGEAATADSYGIFTGNGGDGSDWGVAADSGTTGQTASGNTIPSSINSPTGNTGTAGLSGGIGGYAARENGNLVTWLGGNNGTQVKGVVA